MIKLTTYSLAFLFAFLGHGQVRSPKDFLGYELGERFTQHHRVVDYYEHLAASSANVQLQNYGETYENRPLLLAFVSSAENLNRLEEIRKDNLRRTGLVEGTPNTDVAIIWLSYNVHGNESVSTEASMATIYELLRHPNQDWLDHSIVIIDPCLNPDGRERYVNFYKQHKHTPHQIDPDSWEHHEPWPGGRANHYLFDLNRDWAWMSQKETQHRLQVYNQWLPQIHVDFHEQGINSPYYFAPAAEPYHELITDWQREFQVEIGRNNARYFDENGWLYFTKQYFDLLYPSYGDTYPTFNGAIGMTYEQGGSGRAGLGVETETGQELTLKDRIDHHFTTGISTIEVANKRKSTLLEEFSQFFSEKPVTTYRSYVIKAGQSAFKLNSLKQWLDNLDIEYGMADPAKISGYSYQTQSFESFNLTKEDLVISINQPKAILLSTLFEPQTKLVDSLTYDITAWSIPYARGLNAFAVKADIKTRNSSSTPFVQNILPTSTPYAFMFSWSDMAHARLLSDLLEEGINPRVFKNEVTVEGKSYHRGSIVVNKADNMSKQDWAEIVTQRANQRGVVLQAVNSGFVQVGNDLGSNADVSYLEKPKVALMGGEGTSSLSYGAIWYYFEQTLEYPVVTLSTDYFNYVDLNEYNVLILPSGNYHTLDESMTLRIDDWVKAGGKLILMQYAIDKWVESGYSELKTFNDEFEENQSEERKEAIKEGNRTLAYSNIERADISNLAVGSIFKVNLDQTHPLAFGYGNTYFSLKTTDMRYDLLTSGNVGYVENAYSSVSGFTGHHVLEDIDHSLTFGVEQKGKGSIIYMIDDPLFRAFWDGGKLLFANAVFFGS